MNHRLTPIAATMFAAVAAPLAMQPAFAQTAANAALPEITVKESADNGVKVDTASSVKFTAPLLDTPKSVTVIPSQVISQTGSTSLVEALRTTPGISFTAGEGGTPIGDRPTIRGFDAQSSTFIDGVRDTGSQTRDIFNIESIEVVRGSDSTNGGRSGAGGSINLVTKTPKKEAFNEVNVGVGTDNYKRVVADSNILLGDNAAIRLNAMYYDANVAGRDNVDGTRWGFAPSLKFGLTGPTSVTLSYYHMQSSDMPDYSTPYQNSGVRTKANPEGPVSIGRKFYGLTDRDFRDTKTDIGTVQVQHDFGNSLVVRNTTRYGKTSNDFIVTNPDDSAGNVKNGFVYRSPKSRIADTTTLTNQTDLTGEFKTGSLNHKFAVGLELTREETNVGGYTIFPNALLSGAGRTCGAALLANYNCTSLYNPNANDPWRGSIVTSPLSTKTVTNTKSIYGIDTMELTKDLFLNLGLRYDSYSTTASTPTYTAIVPTTVNGVSRPAGSTIQGTSLGNNASFWNYSAGLVYKLTPEGSIYASYSTASSPPGASTGDGGDNISAANQALPPERTRTMEIGTKWDLFDKQLSLTAAVFKIQKNNARVSIDANTQAVAGKQEVEGFELGVAGNLTKKWTVFGGYSHMNSKLVDNGSYNGAAANNGNQFPNTPEDSFSLWNTYEIMPKLTLGAGVYYVSRVFGNTANTLYVPSYVRYDAMATYAVNKNVTLQLNVQNLTDKIYYDQAFTTHYAHMAPGRSAVLSANLRF
ncbi:TonB-dependent receptor [Herbaspirillum autotrophicum]|uniref:TonB-dependent receptor n=1 Tax=Herbaspirillum autotrophicum TaxID=180195 RepID=UPI00067CFA55|nr:TonB-dependent siderophore receptor [Herbaspirillum autotrophicum]